MKDYKLYKQYKLKTTSLSAQEREFKSICFCGVISVLLAFVCGIKTKCFYSINMPFMYSGLKSFSGFKYSGIPGTLLSYQHTFNIEWHKLCSQALNMG